MDGETPELSIVMPCLNEAETLATCIRKARQGVAAAGVRSYEIVVADNGSTDGSQAIAQAEGARLVVAARRGYGAALLAGVGAAQGKYVMIGDADDSYDWTAIEPFVARLRAGDALVMGTRLRGRILPGAMPPLHRWLGNPALTGIGNLLFRAGVSDFHCGLRGFEREAVGRLGLQTEGMEFATEMVVKATMHGLKISEVPITYAPDGRTRRPHLRTWRDGWRHLSFMLLLSPTWVFLYPAFVLIGLGVAGMALLLPGPLAVGTVLLDVHTLLVTSVGLIVGVQLLTLWGVARLFAANTGLLPPTRPSRWLGDPRLLNYALLGGGLVFVAGLGPVLHAVQLWANAAFGELNYQVVLRWLIPGLVLCTTGIQVFFAGFVMSLMNLSGRNAASEDGRSEPPNLVK